MKTLTHTAFGYSSVSNSLKFAILHNILGYIRLKNPMTVDDRTEQNENNRLNVAPDARPNFEVIFNYTRSL